MTAQRTFSPWHKSEVVRAYIFCHRRQGYLLYHFFDCFSSRNACNSHSFMLYYTRMSQYRQVDLSPGHHYHQIIVKEIS